MDRRFKLLCKKHALIEQKLTKMECFDKFIRTVQSAYPDDFTEKGEALTRYKTQS